MVFAVKYDWAHAKQMADSGATMKQIAADIGCTYAAVHLWAKKHGVRMGSDLHRPYDWDAAMAAAQRGETAQQIAARIGADASYVHRWAKRSGVALPTVREIAARDTRPVEQRLRDGLEYDQDTGDILRRKDGSRVYTLHPTGYVDIRFERRSYKAHRLAWLLMTGAWPPEQIDHINGVRDDNRWSNLRACTKAENARNCKFYRTNTTGFKGVHRAKNGRFVAFIVIDGVKRRVGTFDTPEQASAAYVAAAIKWHGDFHRPSSVSAAQGLAA